MIDNNQHTTTMHLATDEQTLSDLGIFGRRDGNGIYDLYNCTKSRGGEAALKDFFQHPLSDRTEINRRSSLIARFAALKTVFPFDTMLFDRTEKYLDHAIEQASSKRDMLGEKEMRQGVTAVIELLQGIGLFIETEQVKSITAYERERRAIASLLAYPAFAPVAKESLKGKLAYTAVTAYDGLFRLQEYARLYDLLKHIYCLDAYLSVANVVNERKFTFPMALEKGSGTLKLEGVYHPELTSPVSNDVVPDRGKNVLFLTGANMAGKSTFLRSVSTALYVAHIGFPVAARSMEFSVMDGLYTTINLPDNLGIGASHFYNEVLRVKKIATELREGKSLFVVFDELFRGTNVKDAHEATVAVTESFARKRKSLFIICSHIVEAGEDLRQTPSVEFWYLPTTMKGHIPEYTYTLEKGITDDRHGMVIIRNEGILDILEKGTGKRMNKKNHELYHR